MLLAEHTLCNTACISDKGTQRLCIYITYIKYFATAPVRSAARYLNA